jgi:zinc and cadmium transporter
MDVLISIIIATFLVSLISFIGVFTLGLKEKMLKKLILFLIALSAGALIGGAFLHLMPEVIKEFGGEEIFLFVIIGFSFFFFMEKLLCWRHCHDRKCEIHTFAYLNLLGDGIHNFVDGLIIAVSFLSSIELGITTTIAIALHEIPQEIGDFGVLVYGGFKRIKALLMNFLCAIIAIFGGIFGFFLNDYVPHLSYFLLPFGAGGFIYIAASDLIPEIRKERDLKKSLLVFIVFLIGIAIMFFLRE